ncbi:MAG: AAA family ATPase [Paracoccaceae bacterium]
MTPPPFLSGPEVKRMREAYLSYLRLDEKERAQTRPPDRHLPPDPGLLAALKSLFDGKCAFCEGPGPLSTYRFRPTSDAQPQDGADPHGFMAYGWLADAWRNLYPICMDCRPSPMNHFPVMGARASPPSVAYYALYLASGGGPVAPEHPIDASVLLDPCEDVDIGAHLSPLPDGLLSALSHRGEETIRHFRLNRDDLVARRAAAFAAGDNSAHAPFSGLFALLDRFGAAPAPAAPTPAETPAPQEWRLTQIELKAFKALEKIKIEMPAPGREGEAAALLILGENAAGKSSLLEAVALAMVDDAARAELKLDAGRLLLDPRFMGGEDMAARDEGHVRLSFEDQFGGRAERLLKLSPGGFVAEGDAPEGLPVFAYGAYRHYRDNFRNWAAHRGVVSLFESDNLLSNPERWLLSLDERDFDMVVRGLREIFGIGGDFSVIERDFVARTCLVVANHANGAVNRTPLSSVSSGFRTILALSCDVMRWMIDHNREWAFPTLDLARGIVLIDEVEAHLHPRWKVRIMAGLRHALPGVTFIATTHDPLCVRGMRDGEVMVLERTPGAAAGSDLPMMVESLVELPNVTQLTIEQLLTSDLFKLYDTDDPETALAMAELADALVRERNGEDGPDIRSVLGRFRAEIETALPVGGTEIARLVQEAVADYVIERGNIGASSRIALRAATKARIIAALRAV